MAKGDGTDPQGDQFFQQIQQLFQNPQAMQALTGAMKGGPSGGNPITGNPQNFMAGMRKTMGNPNPVNPYGFVPPNQRGGMPTPANPGAAMNLFNFPKYASDGVSPYMGGSIQPVPIRAPQMNMPGSNTGFMGNQNTGITGGMNRTYAPQPMPYIPGGKPGEYNDMGVPYGAKIGSVENPIASTNMGMNMPPAIRMGGSTGMETAGATGGWNPTNTGAQQDNPYAPNKSFGMQSGSRPY